MSIQIIENKLQTFETKYNEIKASGDKNIVAEIETALKGIKTSLEEAKAQSGEEAEVTIGSLLESVNEIEDYINSL